MTKIERAKELLATAKRRAAEFRASEAHWNRLGISHMAAHSSANAEQFDLEAEMYGDLLRTYEKNVSTVETKCPEVETKEAKS